MREIPVHSLVPLLAVALLLGAAGCRSTAPFDPAAQRGPLRVSVIHRPLHPAVGQEVRITASAEGPAQRILITAISGVTGVADETCAGVATCTLVLPAAGRQTEVLYAARVVGSPPASEEVRSPGAYLFTIGEPAGREVYPLRAALFTSGARDVLLVRDRDAYATDGAAQADLEAAVYDQLLRDPVYRWRDGLLSFHWSTHPGRTTDPRGGSLLRCGQEPWLGLLDQAAAEASAAFADVVGVLHRDDGFRDCSGLGVSGAGAGARRHFAAHGERPETFQHELGHALLGLADEYTETTEERTFPGGMAPGPTTCSCCPDGGGTTGPVAGPGLPGNECSPGMSSCVGFEAPPECFPAEPACPPIDSDCLRGNVFASRAACTAAAGEAARHTGVEAAADPADCRLLCSNADPANPCPCDPSPDLEVWILDRHTPPAAGGGGDLMAETTGPDPNHHGPACALCAETDWCIAAETGRGQSLDEAREHCFTFGAFELPPLVDLDRSLLERWLREWNAGRLVRVAAVYRLTPEGLGMRVMAAQAVAGDMPSLPAADPDAGGRVELLDGAGEVLLTASYDPGAPPGDRGVYGDVLRLRLPWLEGAERVRLVEPERKLVVEADLERDFR